MSRTVPPVPAVLQLHLRGLRFVRRASGIATVATALTLAGAVVSSAEAADSCANAAYRTGGGAQLSDCRAYELVSPADKAGYGVEFVNSLLSSGAVVADGGDRVSYGTFTAFAGGDTQLPATYVAARGAAGWTNAQFTPKLASPRPFLPTYGAVGNDFTPDLGAGMMLTSEDFAFDDQNGSASPIEPPNDLYVKRMPGAAQLVGRGAGARTTAERMIFAGWSDDASHVLFGTTDRTITAVDAGRLAGPGLYDRVGGHTVAVDVNTDGTLVSACGATVGRSIPTLVQYAHNAVSDDGNRVVFRAPAEGASGDTSCDDPGQLYLRVGNATTVKISRSRLAVAEVPAAASFKDATRDGSRIWFTSDERLVDGAPSGSTAMLYEYRPADDSLRYIADHVGTVQGVADDGSRIYFSTFDAGTAGVKGYYTYTSGSPSLVVTNDDLGNGPLAPDMNPEESARPTRVSPSGRYLAVLSPLNLTAYDAQDTTQLYVYDAQAPQVGVVCASCPPPGVTPIQLLHRSVAFNGGARPVGQLSSSRNVTDDGRVFFQSPSPLVAEDHNDTKSDVYEFRGGGLSLISGGSAANDSFIVGASKDGRDVFFVTGDTLAPQDIDNGSLDVYDARVGGGLAAPPAPPAECVGDACQAPPAGSAVDPAVATATSSGPGDPPAASRPAAAGKVKLGKSVTHGSTITLRVQVPGKGSVRVTGASVRSVKTTVTKAGDVRIAVKLTAKAAKALRRKGRMIVGLRVRYVPSSGRASSATTSLTAKA